MLEERNTNHSLTRQLGSYKPMLFSKWNDFHQNYRLMNLTKTVLINKQPIAIFCNVMHLLLQSIAPPSVVGINPRISRAVIIAFLGKKRMFLSIYRIELAVSTPATVADLFKNGSPLHIPVTLIATIVEVTGLY